MKLYDSIDSPKMTFIPIVSVKHPRILEMGCLKRMYSSNHYQIYQQGRSSGNGVDISDGGPEFKSSH